VKYKFEGYKNKVGLLLPQLLEKQARMYIKYMCDSVKQVQAHLGFKVM